MSSEPAIGNMTGIIDVPHYQHHLSSFNVLQFPLADNATVDEVLRLVDALALKTLPKGYWQLSWATSSLNLTIFFLIAIAMRAYRSSKTPVPLWLFKLESRPYRIKRANMSSKTRDNRSSSFSTDNTLYPDDTPSKPRLGFKSRLQARFNCFPSTTPRASHEKPQSTSDQEQEQGGEQIRMGKFITASCVNCHFVLTSAYVVLLFLKVAQAFVTQEASSAPPLLSPGILEAFMTPVIFSTAYFAALGYIAILLPNVTPWVWNSSVITSYVAIITVGLVTISKSALSASNINSYRQLLWYELVYLPSLVHPLATQSTARERPAGDIAIKLAKVTYQEALKQRLWLQASHGLVALGGITLAIIYLVILVTLSRKVAMELVQIRNAPLPPSLPQQGSISAVSMQDRKQQVVSTSAVTMWPLTAVPFSLPSGSQPTDPVLKTFLSQPARFSLPLRTGAARAPPLTPPPSGPLPLPPVERFMDSRSSTPDSAAYSVAEVRSELSLRNSGNVQRRSSATFQQQPSASPLQVGQQDRAAASADSKLSFPTHHDDHDGRPSSPTSSSTHRTRLDLGPRTRRDSQPIPWAVNALHEDLATSEGYVAVCRFLFNCIIDHGAVMLQSFAFGSTSIYLTVVYSEIYPNDAQSASLQVGRINMVFSCLFTLLYLINSINLFAPFLLFPTSQVKLATMLTSLYTPNLNFDSGKYRESGRYPRRSPSKRMLRNKRKKATENEAEAPRSRSQTHESSRDLLDTAGKVTSEMYSLKNADSATSRPLSQTGTFCGDAMQFPPAMSTTITCSPFEDREQRGGINMSLEKEGAIRSKIMGPIATAVRLFRTPPPQDVGLNGLTSLRREMTLTSPERQLPTLGLSPSPTGFRAFFKFSPFSPFSPPFSSSSSGAKTDDANTKQRNHFSNISTPISVHHSLPGRNAAGSGSESCYTTCETSPPHASASVEQRDKQLVLDSLISSHALPIQGFYCHRTSALGLSAIGSGGGGLRTYHPNESAESGIGWSEEHVLRPRPKPRVQAKRRFDDAPPVGASRRSQAPPQPHQYEVDNEFGEEDQAEGEMEEYETEEELQISDSQSDSMRMRETSKCRRQRLRQQFRGQIGPHSESIPLQQQQQQQQQPYSSSSSHHDLIQVVVRKASLPTTPQLQQYPTSSLIPQRDSARLGELPRLPGAELRLEARTILACDDGVPSIVAQPPTPISRSRPRAQTQSELDEEQLQMQEHRMMISIPIHFDRSARG